MSDKNLFLAKIKNKETIIEHTDKLLEQFEIIHKLYPNIQYLNWDILYFACLYHDFGKMNSKFQNKIINRLNENNEIKLQLLDDNLDIEEIPHGYLSPSFLPLDELKTIYSIHELRILYQAIFYHHSRLKLDNSEPIQVTVLNDLQKQWMDFNYKKINKMEKLNHNYARYTTNNRIPCEIDEEKTIYQYIMTKGLLNKIDYAASGYVTVEGKNENLFEKTLDYINRGGYKPNDLQEYMMHNQDDNNIIVASTGIGKTEAALFWIGNNKGFFTLPLRVSINSIYDRIVDNSKINFNKELTGLLHSDTTSEYLKRNENVLDIEYIDKTKQLSLPLTICTLDQLIDFIFKYEGYELKLATLSYSKLIIDEIQMYSPEMVAYLIIALKYITNIGGKFSIVTATFPPVFEHFMSKLNINYIKPQEAFYKRDNNGKIQLRHKIKVLEKNIDIEHIKNNYKDKKVLVIVNTVKKAQEVYEELNYIIKDTNIKLLHSKFIKRDRTIKETEIFNMGKLECLNKGIWVTTQVVEASLDIDFDVLYTELSDVSGLLQRMGRVYRNRDLIGNYINVYVYIGNNKRPSGISIDDKSIIDYEIFELSKKAIIKFDEKELDEREKMKLVEDTYSLGSLKGTKYYKKINNTIEKLYNIKAYEVDKKDINLRNIENEIVMPKSIYDENETFIKNNLKTINESQNYNERLIAKNQIKELTLSIPTYEYLFAYKNLLIEQQKIELDKFTLIPIIKFDYTFEKGLQKPESIKLFDEEEQFI